MENNFIKRLSDTLNTLSSLNYTLMEQRKKAMPNDGQMLFSSSDIFRQKSFSEEYEMEVYNGMIEYRNSVIPDLEKSLLDCNIRQMFDNNSKVLVDFFNEHSSNKVNYDDYFKNGYTNHTKLEAFAEQINSSSFDSEQSLYGMLQLFTSFMTFYEQQKFWYIYYDLFCAVKDDINMYGSKSFTYKKPENSNVLVIDKTKIEEFINTTFDKFNTAHSELFKKTSKKTKRTEEEEEKIQYNIETLDYFDSMADLITDRIFFANNPLVKSDKGPVAFLKKLINPNKPEKLVDNEIYIHKQEIADCIEVMEEYPELNEEVEKLKNLLSGKTNTQSKNT